MSTLIHDDHKTHKLLANTQCEKSLFGKLLASNQAPLLIQAGVSIVLTLGKRHEQVSRIEAVMKRIKQVIISVLDTFCYYLNEQPLFYLKELAIFRGDVKL